MSSVRQSVAQGSEPLGRVRVSSSVLFFGRVAARNAQADEAVQYVLELIPSHHEDMALIEQLEQLLEAAGKKARTELGRNSGASAAIDAELNKLEGVLASSAAHSKKVRIAWGQTRSARNLCAAGC